MRLTRSFGIGMFGAVLLLAGIVFVVRWQVGSPQDTGSPALSTPSVPAAELVDSGQSRDGIPSIDEPIFLSTDAAAVYLGDDARGVAVTRGSVARFYPVEVLLWHVVVNDTVANERILVTYSPISGTARVYDPIVNGRRVEFGVAAEVWRSSTVLYDRETESLWSQLEGRAITGPEDRTTLQPLGADLVSFGAWREQYPDGQVLSRTTGFQRPYGTDPYDGYEQSPDFLFPIDGLDDRLDAKTLIYGVRLGDTTKAFPRSVLERDEEVTDSVGEQTLTLRWDGDLATVSAAITTTDGTRTPYVVMPAYWFVWAALNPTTAVAS